MEEKTEGKEVALGGFGVARVALGEDDAGDIKTPFKPIIFILVIIDRSLYIVQIYILEPNRNCTPLACSADL